MKIRVDLAKIFTIYPMLEMTNTGQNCFWKRSTCPNHQKQELQKNPKMEKEFRREEKRMLRQLAFKYAVGVDKDGNLSYNFDSSEDEDEWI